MQRHWLQFQALFLSLLVVGNLVSAADWSVVDKVLNEGIAKHTTPGLVAAVANKNGYLYFKAFGNFTYGIPPPFSGGVNPPMNINTVFDMASLTKVVSTTTAAMILYQAGLLELDMKISDPTLLGADFALNGKADITVRNLMLHNSGFPPDPSPNYWNRPFGCPETSKRFPAENFSCQRRIWAGLMKQTLQHPIGQVYVYSDLSMITMMYVIGKLARVNQYIAPSDLLPACAADLTPHEPSIDQCYYEAFVRKFVLERMDMTQSSFIQPTERYKIIAPTWNDTDYRHVVMQGTVSDGNAYAMGGIAGHAGLFSTIDDTAKLCRKLLWASSDDDAINSTTVSTFTKVYDLNQSSRALGWDTNDYTMNTYRGCGNLSPQTYTHTGYTGTQICNDPVRNVVVLLFTNRCYPDSTKTLPDIKVLRQNFSNAVVQVLDASQ